MSMPRTKGLDRPNRLNLNLSDEERDLLARLAEHAGVNVSDLVRGWLRSEAASTLGWKPRAKKAATKGSK